MIDLAGLPKNIIKRYGISKKAWAVYRSQHTAARPASTGGKKVAKRRRASSRRSSAKRGAKRGGIRLLGNMGLKGMLMGGAMLFASRSLLGGIGGEYNAPLTMIAAGVGSKAVGVSGASLAGAGVMELGATLVGKLLSGGIALPFIGGGGVSGGYDY